MSRIEEALRRASLKSPQPVMWEEDGNAPSEAAAVAAVATLSDQPDSVDYRAERTVDLSGPPVVSVADEPHETEPPAFDTSGVSEKLIVSGAVRPVVIEQFRKIAVALHQLQVERGIKTVMVASAMPAEGKTLTASNIALTLSESLRRNVLLIDADLRRPTVHKIFPIPNVSGLSDGLNSEEELRLTIIQASPRLSVLTAGRPQNDPMSGLSSDRMGQIIKEASAQFDWVVIDTPPVGLLPDANLLAKMVDAVILVIGASATPYRQVERAVAAIDRKRIVGVVLNRAVGSQAGGYGYYDYNYSSKP